MEREQTKDEREHGIEAFFEQKAKREQEEREADTEAIRQIYEKQRRADARKRASQAAFRSLNETFEEIRESVSELYPKQADKQYFLGEIRDNLRKRRLEAKLGDSINHLRRIEGNGYMRVDVGPDSSDYTLTLFAHDLRALLLSIPAVENYLAHAVSGGSEQDRIHALVSLLTRPDHAN